MRAIREMIEVLQSPATPTERLDALHVLLHEQTRHINVQGNTTKRLTPVIQLWKARLLLDDDWGISQVEEAIAFEDEHRTVMLLTGSVSGTRPPRPGDRVPREWHVCCAWRIEPNFGLITEFAEFGDASGVPS
jgi:hypothetical protein